MSNYILDTNIISALGAEEEEEGGVVSNKLYGLSDSDNVSVSILTLYEENYGLKNTNDEERRERFQKNLDFVQQFFYVIPLDIKEMEIYADLKIAYKNHTGISKKDAKKNDIDLLIASTAIALDATLVSNDRIFKTLSEIDSRLKYENWLMG
jgi:predicted nucleic acid-binding protein